MRRYLLASAALGLVSFWASEIFFWSAAPGGTAAGELMLTWAAYAVCAAAALSAVLASGVQGWRAAFLGGALLGWCVEGVVVPTMYQAFPFQVVWTPLAWHALVTGLLVVGMGRAAPGWRPSRRIAAWSLLGLAGGLWAVYWPIERGAMPGLVATLGYLLGIGLLAPLAQLLLDRLDPLPRPGRGTLLAAPLLVLAVWLAQVLAAPSPVHLAWPAVIGVTWWAMRRLGEPGTTGLRLGGAGPAERRVAGQRLVGHAAFLLTPALAAVTASALWAAAPSGWPANVPVALVTGVGALWLYARLLRQAVRGPRERDALTIGVV